jgi:uncharacterized protein (DUF2237 family)
MIDECVYDGLQASCCLEPRTGFFRDGLCRTNEQDTGRHLVCARVTSAFLEFTKARGNDLQTPAPHFNFPGLRPGDKWCLCVLRWKEALSAGVAPPVVLEATHENALQFVTLAELQAHRAEAPADNTAATVGQSPGILHRDEI